MMHGREGRFDRPTRFRYEDDALRRESARKKGAQARGKHLATTAHHSAWGPYSHFLDRACPILGGPCCITSRRRQPILTLIMLTG